MRKSMLLLLFGGCVAFANFDEGISIGDKVKIRHLAQSNENGVVGNTQYVYEADKRETVEDVEGGLETNSVITDGETLRRTRKLIVEQTQENITIRRVSGVNKNRDILKSQMRNREKGIEIGKLDIRGQNITHVKTYRRNNHYHIEK